MSTSYTPSVPPPSYDIAMTALPYHTNDSVTLHGAAYPSNPNVAATIILVQPPLPEVRTPKTYHGSWKVSCLGVCCSDPGVCLYAELCLPCLLYHQRKQLMAHHAPPLTHYVCCMDHVGGQYMSRYCRCNGPYPMDGCCGKTCLGCETCCCFFASVPAHRREIKAQYGTHMGKEEWAAHVVACASWCPVFGLAGGFLVGYLAYCCYACLAAQQQVEIDTQNALPPPPSKQTMF